MVRKVFFFPMSHLKALSCHVNWFLLPILQRTQRTLSFLYLPGSLSYCKAVITSYISFILSGFKLEALQLSLTDIILTPCSPSLPLPAWSPGTPRFLPVLHQSQTQLWEAALTPYRATSSESHPVSHRQRKFWVPLLPLIYPYLCVELCVIVFALPPPTFFSRIFPQIPHSLWILVQLSNSSPAVHANNLMPSTLFNKHGNPHRTSALLMLMMDGIYWMISHAMHCFPSLCSCRPYLLSPM